MHTGPSERFSPSEPHAQAARPRSKAPLFMLFFALLPLFSGGSDWPSFSLHQGELDHTPHGLRFRDGTFARTFFASMTDKVRPAHIPMRTQSIFLLLVIMAAIRLSGPTFVWLSRFLAHANDTVKPAQRRHPMRAFSLVL